MLVRILVIVTMIVAMFIFCGQAGAHPRPLPKPFVAGIKCIHGYEGSWHDADSSGNGYWGGLQMDIAFMRTYGLSLLKKKGYAHRWTPHEQVHVAHKAWVKRGWWPWQRAARLCGLLR
jgi:hypothetical protein